MVVVVDVVVEGALGVPLGTWACRDRADSRWGLGLKARKA